MPPSAAGRSAELRDVVVGTEIQPAELVGFLAFRGEEQNGCVPLLPKGRAQLEAIDAGQHHVEHSEVRPELPHLGERTVRVGDALDVEPLEAEIVPEDPGHREIVFHDQDALPHSRCERYARPARRASFKRIGVT